MFDQAYETTQAIHILTMSDYLEIMDSTSQKASMRRITKMTNINNPHQHTDTCYNLTVQRKVLNTTTYDYPNPIFKKLDKNRKFIKKKMRNDKQRETDFNKNNAKRKRIVSFDNLLIPS